jgi:L-aminopeptidase/D-esterase-like protein
VPRVTDLGITIGLLPSGPTGSVLDVPGVGLGHATVWRDEPPPPAGRGIARTGVTVIDPGGDLFAAVTEATEEAVINSLLQSVTVTGRDGNTSYQLPAGSLRDLLAGHAAGSRPL